MRWFCVGLMFVVAAVGASPAAGQQRVARVPSTTGEAAPSVASPGQAALERAAAAKKILFIFFWKEKTPQTEKALGVWQTAMTNMADVADSVAIQTANPAEKKIVERFAVSRSPMPMVLAVAPCGAVTKAVTGTFDEKKLRAAIVSPGTQLCLKALQDRKLVLLCVGNQTAEQGQNLVPKGVQEFQADQRYSKATEVVLVSASDANEATLLKEFQVDPRAQQAAVVFLAPPGSLVGKFNGNPTKEQLVAKLTAAQSSCCPGGQCGPNGCGPKK